MNGCSIGTIELGFYNDFDSNQSIKLLQFSKDFTKCPERIFNIVRNCHISYEIAIENEDKEIWISEGLPVFDGKNANVNHFRIWSDEQDCLVDYEDNLSEEDKKWISVLVEDFVNRYYDPEDLIDMAYFFDNDPNRF